MNKIKKDDMVQIIAGKDKGKSGKVLSVDDPELCAFSFDVGETFLVILSNKKASELFDSDNTRSVHSYYVTYIKENDKWRKIS